MGFRSLVSVFVFLLIQCSLSSCAVLAAREPKVLNYADLSEEAMKPEEAKAFFGDVAENWFYGSGLGRTAVHTGAAIAFPPYALVLIGNSLLSLRGYQSVGVSSILPEERKESWEDLCDLLYSAPGRVTAAIAGKQFRTREIAEASLQKYIEKKPKTEDSLFLEEIL